MRQPSKASDRRLIVDLYHGPADAETLRAAAEIARLLGFDLHGLFIEDESLLALAEFPFAREIRLPTHEWSPMNAVTVTADLREAATRMHRLLDDILRSVGVPGAFQVLRGDPVVCIGGVCRIGDIIVVEPETPVRQLTQSIAHLQEAAFGSPASVLLLPAGTKLRAGPVVARLEGAEDSSLEVACHLAAATKDDLVILPLAQVPGGHTVADRALALGMRREQISLRPITGFSADNVLHALTGLQERLVVADRRALVAGEASRIAAARRVPLLLIEARVTETRADQPSG